MRKFLDSKIARDMALYIGIGSPYFFLLYNVGVDFSGLNGTFIIFGLYLCIDLARWGLRK